MNYQRCKRFGQVTSEMIIQLTDDGLKKFIPADTKNVDWQDYQDWLSQGNTPLDAD